MEGHHRRAGVHAMERDEERVGPLHMTWVEEGFNTVSHSASATIDSLAWTAWLDWLTGGTSRGSWRQQRCQQPRQRSLSQPAVDSVLGEEVTVEVVGAEGDKEEDLPPAAYA